MNKETLWGLLIQNNPRLTDDPHLTPESARRFFDMVWNTAYGAGCKDMVERQREIAGLPCEKGPEPHEHDEPTPHDLLKLLIEAVERLNDEEQNSQKKKKH